MRVTWIFSSLALTISNSAAMTVNKVIDSHLHVWADSVEKTAFPYSEGQEPPESLQDGASVKALLQKMDDAKVDGALIVQPINHKYDHSYVANAIKEHPDRFKGMLLLDPSLNADDAVSQLEDLVLKGFVGVRFNPYLWPKKDEGGWEYMSSSGSGGLAVYKRCAELHMPVGVMCFQGLQLHYEDILELLKASPKTTMVLDHFGFTGFTEEGDKAFTLLLKLAEYPQVMVKVSALFRQNDDSPYDRVKTERLVPLLEVFGPDRLMFGTDFPFVLEQPGSYGGTVDLVKTWLESDENRNKVMGGTVQKAFGAWGVSKSS